MNDNSELFSQIPENFRKHAIASIPTVTFLVEHGVERTICDINGKTPLELCRDKSEWEDIFNYLNGLESATVL